MGEFKQAVLDIVFLTGSKPRLARDGWGAAHLGVGLHQYKVEEPATVQKTLIGIRDDIVKFLTAEQSLIDTNDRIEKIVQDFEEQQEIQSRTPVDWAVISFNEAVELYGHDTDAFIQAITRVLGDLNTDVGEDEEMLVASLFMNLKIYDYLLEEYGDDLGEMLRGSLAWMADMIANTLDEHGAQPDRDWDKVLHVPEWEEDPDQHHDDPVG